MFVGIGSNTHDFLDIDLMRSDVCSVGWASQTRKSTRKDGGLKFVTAALVLGESGNGLQSNKIKESGLRKM